MGLFSFVKNAGAKLWGGKKKTQEERIAELNKTVTDLGFEVKGLLISLDDDKVAVSGEAKSYIDREKIVLALGNVEGVASVDDNMSVYVKPADVVQVKTVQVKNETITPTPVVEHVASTFYTVAKGDTLGKIAKKHYGNAMKYPVIFEANKPMLSHPDKIYPGQTLRIPPLDTVEA